MTNQSGRFFIEKNGRSIEPRAGRWRTWVISSGKDYRVPPPPGPAETRGELQNLANLIRHNDATTRDRIEFWDAGAPGYRWLDLVSTRVLAGQTVSAYPHRVYTYLALAMYDATIATWESKYHYRRPRPSDVDTAESQRRSTCPIRRRIHPNMQQPHRPPRACSRTSSRPRRTASRKWPKRRDGRACSPACSIRATITQGSRSASASRSR